MLRRLLILNYLIKITFLIALLTREVNSSRNHITSELNTQNVKTKSGLKETVHHLMLLLLSPLWLIDTARSINKRLPSLLNNYLPVIRTLLWDVMEDMLPELLIMLRDKES